MHMKIVDATTILDNLKWRYAVKKFDAQKKIPEPTWKALEEALVLSPSSYGLQPWKFFVIKDPAVRATLRTASWNQSQITDASHLVVLARKATVTPADVDQYVQRIMEVRGAPAAALEDYRQMMLGSVNNPAGLPGGSMDTYTRSQVYIALGFFLFAAAQLGIDACPMEGFDPAKYDEILGLTAMGYKATVVATSGYRAADDWLASLPKVRKEPEDVIATV
jgi:nitroreductase